MFANLRAVRPALQVGKVVGSAVDEKNSEGMTLSGVFSSLVVVLPKHIYRSYIFSLQQVKHGRHGHNALCTNIIFLSTTRFLLTGC